MNELKYKTVLDTFVQVLSIGPFALYQFKYLTLGDTALMYAYLILTMIWLTRDR